MSELNSRIQTVDDIYTLGEFDIADMATMQDLQKLTDMFDTDWALLAGTDFGDPYAERGQARTILSVWAKGLAGSRSTPTAVIPDPKYIYFLLCILNVEDHSLDVVKKKLDEIDTEFDGLDILCSERYGAWDLKPWCEEREVIFEPIYPSYNRQVAAFKEILLLVREGRLKAPIVPIVGSKKRDIFREEMGVFMHDGDKKWFGSPEKKEKYGIQDDTMYSLGWGVYGGREISFEDFRVRSLTPSFGYFVSGGRMSGKY